MKNKTIAISGGFDPVHIGHLQMIQGAAQHGSVIVILNSDAWLEQKKGYVFMPFEERKAILEAFSDVHHVVSVDDSDGTVCAALDQLRPCYFGNGGDRVSDNVPEVKFCKRYGVGLKWNLGGDKIQSSSTLVTHAKDYDYKDGDLKHHNDPENPFRLEIGGEG
jgi:D-beta-D-heptose 7-phosphate kinase/D-beta-D-heptose 1-phosphate adenosyltransferase